VLAPGTTPKDVEKQIAKVQAAHTTKDVYKTRHYLLQELRELHNDTRFMNYSGRTISKETILTLGLIALFLLLTGSINYINLATAQSTLRSKEIGLRKVLGSYRKNIILQFLAETFVVVSIAGMIALVGAEILIVNLQSLLNLSLTQYNFTDPFILLSLLAIVLIVTLFSGLYPSLVISRFNPISALKNKFTIERVGNISFRKILVVTQFSITQMLAVGTFIVVSQIRFFQHVDMGFNREAIITVNFPDDAKPQQIKVVEDQLRAQAFVSDVSFSSTLPSGVRRDRTSMSIGKPEAVALNDYRVFEYQAVDPSYLDVYQIKLLAGRNLMLQDSSKNILINKSLARKLELGSPEEAVGQELKMAWGDRVTVVGVVADYYSNSMKEGAANVVLMVNIKAFDFASIKLDVQHEQGSLPDAIGKIEKIWTSSFPDYIFNYEFFDENIKAFYAQEEKYAQLFQLFSVIFLLIGCLGLYGLVTFVVNRKGKEIAIRKVLGATVSSILVMFSGEYVRLIVLSFLIAVPVAYYAVDSWFSNFTNHIDLQWWFFMIPGLLILVIALLVVATKTFRIAHANPVDKLKYE
jgi:putative ABC transport system permease protein